MGPLLAVALIGGMLAGAQAASASVLSEYLRLAKRNIKPAPLVPTTAPSLMHPLDRATVVEGSRGPGGYLVRLLHRRSTGDVDAVIALQRGPYRSLRPALAEARRTGFRARATRVRGRRGYVLTRTRPSPNVELVWVEDGIVYMLGTGTPKKVSLAGLRTTAAGLEHLRRSYNASVYDQQLQAGHGALMITTDRTVTGTVEWAAACKLPDGSPTSTYAGSADFTLVRRSGDAFAVDIAARSAGIDWRGRLAGTLAALELRVTGSGDGLTCDTGAVSLRTG